MPLLGGRQGRVLGGSPLAEPLVWPLGLVLLSPRLDVLLGFAQGCEVMEVQALVPQFAVEAFNEAILESRAP